MRYLLVFLAILLLVWRWRSARATALQERQQAAQNRPPVKGAARTMVACAQCGVHVPADDACSGTRGSYCSTAHRQQAEG